MKEELRKNTKSEGDNYAGDFRCCMCPNINTPQHKICPPGGPCDKPETLCKFVKAFRDENGATVFVSDGIALDDKTWFTVRQLQGKGSHRIKTKFLPIRETFDEAQSDLNKYAKQKGWAMS
jgi:hypothetical protein